MDIYCLSDFETVAPEDPEVLVSLRPVAFAYVASTHPGAFDGRGDDTAQAGICVVRADVTPEELAALKAAAGVRYIPFEDSAGNVLPLTATCSQLDPQKQLNIRAWLEGHHIPVAQIDPDTTTLGDLLGIVLHRLRFRQILKERDFTEHLDVTISGLTALRRSRLNERFQAHGFDTSVIQPDWTIRRALLDLSLQDIPANDVTWS